MRRRDFLASAATAWAAAPVYGAHGPQLTRKERVDRALQGKETDRTPFSFWHHFGLTTPEAHAKATLDFHRQYRTDIVKVMSDFPYPKPAGKWYEGKIEQNPFPQQIHALELIRDGLNGDAYFIETIFNPWNVAEKLSSREEVRRLQASDPKKLMALLDVITQSEINHVRRAISTGASGILLSVANANSKEMTAEDYQKFSAPFDRRILAAFPEAKLNVLHLHVEAPYLAFFHDFPAPIVNYSNAVSRIPISAVRQQFRQVIAGGIDEVNYRKLDQATLTAQYRSAKGASGAKYILTPGCSVPNDSTPAELERLPRVLGA